MSTPGKHLIARLFHAAVIAFLATPVLLVQSTLATAPVTERVSLDSAGFEGDRASIAPSVDANGRWVVFASEATDLVTGDTNAAQDIFLHDWLTGATSRLSVNSQGQEADAASSWPDISADGNWVAFASAATNLVEGDTNGVDDIFVIELASGSIERVSLSSSRTQANAASSKPVISGDGQFVAFTSNATNLFNGADSDFAEVYLYDRGRRTLQWVSAPIGSANNGNSGEAAISDDGFWVAFSSGSSQLVSNDSDAFRDIFLWSWATGAITRVSVGLTGQAANSLSYHPALSADGRYVAFRSHASNLVPVDSNGFTSDIFRRDMASGSTQLVSIAHDGISANLPSDEPVISADGRFIAFNSYASNLIPEDTNENIDIFVRDMQGTTTRVSVDSNGSHSNLNDFGPAMNTDGSAVTFYSEATNLDLVRVDVNGVSDVFAHGDKPLPEPTATPTEEPTATATEEPTPTETATPEPTLTPTAIPPDPTTPTPTPTATADPTKTTTPDPTFTATAIPTTVTPDPTDPPHTCSWVIDFETDALGNLLSPGQIIDDEWSPFGIFVTTTDPGKHPAMIFDSSNPTGYDWDLGSPNEDFGGPGLGSGGEEDQPGENRWPLENVLIITEDMDQSDPDDHYAGGTFIFTFERPAKIKSVQLLDIDANETAVKISAYDQNGKLLGTFKPQFLGNNSVEEVSIQLESVARLEIKLQSSGAIGALSFCDEKPTPKPTVPAPTEEPDPTEPPSVNAAPVVEMTTEVSVKEGSPISVSGSFKDGDFDSVDGNRRLR